MMKLLCSSAFLLTFTALFAACSSTTPTGTWRDPEFRGKIHKVYIVGVTSKDINRYQFEDAVSHELQTRGVTAIPSYREGDFPVDLDELKIADHAFANGADTVLVARVLGNYIGQTDYKIVALEVILYETKTGNPIWSSKFETVLDRRYDLLFSNFAKAVASDLDKYDLL